MLGFVRSRLIPRSLTFQALLLLGIGLGLTLLVGAVVFSPLSEAQFRAELSKRGAATVQTLEKHADLRLAVSLRDAAQATPVLEKVAGSDEDIRYIAVLGPDKKPFAQLKASPEELEKAIPLHFEQGAAKGDLLRFTLPFTREASAGGDDLGMLGEAAGQGQRETLGYLLMALSPERARGRLLAQTFVSVGTTALLLAALFVLYFRWVSRRLKKMVSFAEAIAQGQLDSQLDDPVEDELGKLASALSLSARSTASILKELGESSRSLNTVAGELVTTAARHATNAQRQATGIAEMEGQLGALKEAFEQASQRSEAVIEVARRSEKASASGTEAVKETLAQMQGIRDQVAIINKQMQAMVDRSVEIGAIIEAVSEIAEQSNLLALNAGIEAARAGEEGRGFAVVASEMRTLAAKSRASTAKVRVILKDVSDSIRNVLSVFAEGQRRAEAGAEVARGAGDAIEGLASSLSDSSQAAAEIAAATREQLAGVSQIAEAATTIGAIATETAASTRQLDAASDEIGRRVAEMQATVSRFRI
jgi:methyl-accepting chemotaxis protein